MTRALVLHSGGLDSTVALALALLDRNPADVQTISFWYGQKHATELEAAANVADYYGVKRQAINISFLIEAFSGSAITAGDVPMPHRTYRELHDGEGPSPTYVPYRNGVLLSIATAVAVRHGFDYLYAGMHGEDAHNYAYPDCTPEFLGAQANAINVGSYYKTRLVTPFQFFDKAQVVDLGLSLEAPLHLTLSCYEGTVPACGKCPTCVSRLNAFSVNNVKDPIEYVG